MLMDDGFQFSSLIDLGDGVIDPPDDKISPEMVPGTEDIGPNSRMREGLHEQSDFLLDDEAKKLESICEAIEANNDAEFRRLVAEVVSSKMTGRLYLILRSMGPCFREVLKNPRASTSIAGLLHGRLGVELSEWSADDRWTLNALNSQVYARAFHKLHSDCLKELYGCTVKWLVEIIFGNEANEEAALESLSDCPIPRMLQGRMKEAEPCDYNGSRAVMESELSFMEQQKDIWKRIQRQNLKLAGIAKKQISKTTPRRSERIAKKQLSKITPRRSERVARPCL